MDLIRQPAESNRLGDFLQDSFAASWHTFRAAIAFVKRSGTRHIVDSLRNFSKINSVEIIVGVDLQGTSKEGLSDLLHAIGKRNRVVVFHNPIALTFHPKIYLFRSDTRADVLIGSGNLTEGGLFTNYEASIRLKLDLGNTEHQTFLRDVESTLDKWADLSAGTARVLDEQFLTKLVALGYVPVEALSAPATAEERPKRAATKELKERLFTARGVPRAPSIQRAPRERRSPTASAPSQISEVGESGFVITLQQTDVGIGQTTKGKARRSPELFLPVICVRKNPTFWGWPKLFKRDRSWKGPIDNDGFGKMDREGVRMRLGGNILQVNWWYNPDKKDFRLRNEALRSAGNVGDILRIELANSKAGFDYYVEVVPQGTTQYPVYLALCTNAVKNSKKTFGYY